MRKAIIFTELLGYLVTGLLFPVRVLAYTEGNGCTQNVGGYTDIPSLGCLAQIVTNIISLAFAFLGVVFLVLLLWGAIRFIISRGDPKGIQEAQKTILYAIIGAVVVLGSFILINIVTTTLGLPDILTNFKIYW